MIHPVTFDAFITEPGTAGNGDKYLVSCLTGDPKIPANRLLHMHRTDSIDEAEQVRREWRKGFFPADLSMFDRLKDRTHV